MWAPLHLALYEEQATHLRERAAASPELIPIKHNSAAQLPRDASGILRSIDFSGYSRCVLYAGIVLRVAQHPGTSLPWGEREIAYLLVHYVSVFPAGVITAPCICAEQHFLHDSPLAACGDCGPRFCAACLSYVFLAALVSCTHFMCSVSSPVASLFPFPRRRSSHFLLKLRSTQHAPEHEVRISKLLRHDSVGKLPRC